MKTWKILLPAGSSNIRMTARLQCWLLILLIQEISVASTLHRVFLNSYAHCGHDKTFPVTPDLGYWVQPNVSPNIGTKIFRDCETNFYSKGGDGIICLVQDGRLSEINDNNAELLVHDGYSEEDPLIFKLKHFPDYWGRREYCAKSGYINFYLRSINKTRSVDISKVHLDFKVLDIESRDRRLYMDEYYCNQTYSLLYSQVNIFNLPPHSWRMPTRMLSSRCWMKIEKERTEERSICLVYAPSEHVTCSGNWTITISLSKDSLSAQDIKYQLHCHDKQAQEMHVWCASNQTHSITLTLQRASGIASNSSMEIPEMFQFILADYEGAAGSFLDEIRRELGRDSSDSSGLEVGWIIFIVVGVVVLIAVAVVVVIYRMRNSLPCVKYKAVLNPQSPTPV